MYYQCQQCKQNFSHYVISFHYLPIFTRHYSYMADVDLLQWQAADRSLQQVYTGVHCCWWVSSRLTLITT